MRNFNIKIVVLILLFNINVNGQNRNDLKAGLLNVGLGGVVGGLGAIINKKSKEKIGKVFLKGFSQGALGGYLIFESKRLVGKYSETGDYAYIWPSKIINSAGNSIIENAAANRNFWDRWHFNIGFNRIEFFTKDKFKVSFRVMPFALGSTIYGFTKGHLSFNESLKTGTFVFIAENISIEGRSVANIILLSNNKTLYSKELVIGHELIHVYQYESFSGFNSFLNKPLYTLNKNKNWSLKYHKIFYTDYNYILSGFGYIISGNGDNNLFESEAQYYTEE